MKYYGSIDMCLNHCMSQSGSRDLVKKIERERTFICHSEELDLIFEEFKSTKYVT